MAQLAIIEKIARNCEQAGLTATRGTSSVVITNGGNALTVSLVNASIQSPMGGIVNTAAPFLGIGIANPTAIKIKSASQATGTYIDVIDGLIALTLFHEVSGFASDITLENLNAGYAVTLRGHCDIIGLGQ